MIDQITKDRIIDAAQIVDVVSDFVTLRKRGANYVGLCPFHADKSPSFYVSPAKNVCKCFACGKGGSAVHFIMEHEQLSYTDALKYLAKKYGIEVKERELTSEERQSQNERESTLIVNQFASEFYHNQLLHTEEGRSIGMAYFHSRGFRDDIVEKFQLGYAPQKRDAFPNAAKAKGFEERYIASYQVTDAKTNSTIVRGSGICYKREDGSLYDRYAGRVVFPWTNLSGKVIAFGARLLDSRTKGVAQKYVNSPDTDTFHKERELYGIYQARKAIVKEDCVYMVEGYTDVISMHQCGVENVVANSGTALSNRQITILHRLTNNIVLLYDGDEAGIKAAKRGAEMLLAEGMRVKVCLLPDGDDPDSFARKHTADEYRQFIKDHSTDYVRFKTAHLIEEAGNDPLKRAQIIKDVVLSIALIDDEITRDVFVKETAAMLQVDIRQMVTYVAEQRRLNFRHAAEQKEREQNAAAARQEGSQPATNGQEGAPNTPQTIEVKIDAEPAGTASTAQPEKRYDTLFKYERQLAKLLVRYGEYPINIEFEDGTVESIPLAKAIQEDLESDDIVLKHPLYKAILEQALEHVGDEGFKAEQYFANHPDTSISNLSVSLISEPYELSRIHSKTQPIVDDSERLGVIAPQILISYKLAIVSLMLNEQSQLLKDPAVIQDPQKVCEVMEQCVRLREMQSKLAANAGSRVVMK